ncbi:MAG: polyamine aminopropyltransferase [Acidimicrobiales bacterium]
MPPPSPDLVEPSTSGAELIRRRRLLLFVAAVIAGAGVAYELSLMLLGTVTIGSTERANAIVLGTAMLGMGVGATNGGRWAGRPVAAFIRVEMVLALLGAGAAPLLYWTWARLDAFWGPLLGVAFAIGVCIGAEMPLLAALNERLAAQSPTKVVADYTAADYFGALVGAIAFAFVVRPFFGIVEGTVLVAVVNLLAAAAVALIVPGSDPRRVVPLLVGGAGALAALALVSPTIVADGQQAQFRDPIVAAVDSGIQELVVTSRTHPGGVVDTRLFLDGDLQLSSVDEFRYHEALVHPAVTGAANVLILGGGDCLAAREILRHPEVESITMVELDSGVVELMRTVPELAVLPNGACDDPRLQIVNDDAFTWVDRRASEGRVGFDAVIVDFPDPDTPALGRLYSVELYERVGRLLRPNGRVVVQCGSPFFAPEAFWTCADTLEAAGFVTLPYHVDVPSFGDWGFHLATLDSLPPTTFVALPDNRFLTAAMFAAAQNFSPDVARSNVDTRPSTILDPSIVEAAQGAWIGYGG